jgi:sulfide:quinone oxidoreductase
MAAPGFDVVVCGGGIAGTEGMLRLRRLAGDRVHLTIVSPGAHLAYRPLAVREPFALAAVRRYPLERIVADVGARWVRDRLSSVNRANRTVHTDRGADLPYDALLLAVGARESSPYEHAAVFTDRNASDAFHEIIRGLETGRVGSLVFVLPHEWVWPLPLYELALMAARRARCVNRNPQITLVTSEGRPLKAFGQAAGDAIRRLLGEAGITLYTGVRARVPAPGVVRGDDLQLEADRIVTLPKITGPAIRGVPAGTRWFVPINERCVVPCADGRVFAAGDATDFPVKHGGIGAQQADTAAAGIAHLAGLGNRPPPVHPVIRGSLLTGGQPLYIAARVSGGLGWQSEIYEQPPWPAEEKIVAEELGDYLATLEPVDLQATTAGWP